MSLQAEQRALQDRIDVVEFERLENAIQYEQSLDQHKRRFKQIADEILKNFGLCVEFQTPGLEME